MVYILHGTIINYSPVRGAKGHVAH